MVENGQLIPDKVTTHGQTYIHLLRTCVIAFALYFAFMGLAFQVGVLGCWKVSSRKIICTSVLITLAFFFGTSGLILFEGVKYFERYKVSQLLFSGFLVAKRFFLFIIQSKPLKSC